MDIECKLKREGGTFVPMGKIEYHFAPREDGAHVADVQDDDHADRFLGIPEAYRLYRGKAAAPLAASTAPAITSEEEAAKNTGGTPGDDNADEILLGSSVHPATFDINGKTYALGDVVALAHKDSGLDVKEWNELEDASRADLIDEALDKLQADANGDGAVDGAEERAALVEQYKAKFNKSPGNMGVAKLRAALEAE